jgi:tripartite-type tricarboxylate transporter receptor subunit TctC
MPPVAATVPGYEAKSWLGIATSSNVPQPIVERLNRDVRAVLEMPGIKRKLETMGNEVRGSSPEQMRTMIASEITRWKQVIKHAGIPQQ